jgi:hypothetical protein
MSQDNSYSGSQDQKDHGSRSTQAKKKKKNRKKKPNKTISTNNRVWQHTTVIPTMVGNKK